MKKIMRIGFLFTVLFTFTYSQEKPKSILPGPDRAEGDGPFDRLVIRGATVIDGSGGPPRGPVDIVIEGNRIHPFVVSVTQVLQLMKSAVRKKEIMKLMLTVHTYYPDLLICIPMLAVYKKRLKQNMYINFG